VNLERKRRGTPKCDDGSAEEAGSSLGWGTVYSRGREESSRGGTARKAAGSTSCFDTSDIRVKLQHRDPRNPCEAMVKCIMHNCGRGYVATMMALEKGIVWGADVVMLQEFFEKEGYPISHPGYRLVRGGRTMTAIRRDTHLEFWEVDKGGEGDVQVFNIRYPSGRKMRLVNVYDQQRQERGMRSQGRPAQ